LKNLFHKKLIHQRVLTQAKADIAILISSRVIEVEREKSCIAAIIRITSAEFVIFPFFLKKTIFLSQDF